MTPRRDLLAKSSDTAGAPIAISDAAAATPFSAVPAQAALLSRGVKDAAETVV